MSGTLRVQALAGLQPCGLVGTGEKPQEDAYCLFRLSARSPGG